MDGKLNTKLEKKPKTERNDCAKEKRRGEKDARKTDKE